MSTEENKEWVRKVYKETSEVTGDVSKMRLVGEKYYAPSFVMHQVSGGDLNWDQAEQYMDAFVSAFPDLNFSIDDMVAEGDKVAVRYTMKGTHKGTFMNIPATGKQVLTKGVEINKIVQGRCVETWIFPDRLGTMTQLGAIPGAAPKK
jgi:steroid delta-isomerase-like uncharacterized protein